MITVLFECDNCHWTYYTDEDLEGTSCTHCDNGTLVLVAYKRIHVKQACQRKADDASKFNNREDNDSSLQNDEFKYYP